MANPSKWIRINSPFPLPTYLRESLQTLFDAGFVAYVVGGSVRDFLLGRESKDHDVATNASPDELCDLFPGAVTVGKAFGVIKVPVDPSLPGRAGEFIEIATFREDSEYADHRHPKFVRFSGPEEDARRRDFTINALFYDPKSSRILDVTGGMEDLKSGTLRAIGDPKLRFREDALRLLRAVRFVASLGFKLETETEAAIRARAKLIHHVSAERIRDELTLILRGKSVAAAVSLLSELGLLECVLPEVKACLDDHLLRSLYYLERCYPERSAALSWAVILHESGRPDPAKTALSVGLRLKMARTETDQIVAMIQELPKFRDAFTMREATLVRFLSQRHFAELLAAHRVHALALDGNLAFYEFCASRLETHLTALPAGIPRLVDGKDLIQLGFKPGPEFSEILRTVEDLAIEGAVRTQEEALEYIVKHYVK